MSKKTMLGLPSRWAKVFPANNVVHEIFLRRGIAYNCLHYADYGSPDPEFAKNLLRAMRHSGKYLDAVQLDIPWPDPQGIADAIQAVKRFPEVILQVGQQAFEEIDNDPDLLIRKLNSYTLNSSKGPTSVIHRVLLDRSMGEGKPLDPQDLLRFMRVIREKRPDLGLVVAGGIGPKTLNLLDPILAEFPDVSTDSQGAMTEKGSGSDALSMNIVLPFLDQIYKKLTETKAVPA